MFTDLRRRWFSILPLAMLLIGCDDVKGPFLDGGHALEPGYALLGSDADVRLLMEGEVPFEPGQEVTLVLENRASETINFNLCFHSVEVRQEDGWSEVEPEEDRYCTLMVRMLESGGTAEYGSTLLQGLSSGHYRYRVALYLTERNEHRDQVSAPFQIGG